MQQPVPMTQGTEPETENAKDIFEKDYQRIFRYIMSMVRDTVEAEDLTQETFLRAYHRRDSLREAGAQTAWLYRIATHVCLDRLRQYARRAPRESETDLDEVDVAEPDRPSLQQTLEQDDMSECVQGYLNHLSDSYRAVILLYDMHELSAPEIAQLLGQSLATVKIRLHRARLKLKAALQAGCEFSHDERNVLMCESKGSPIAKKPRIKKVSEDFTLHVDGVTGVCPAAEAWAEQKILYKKIPVLACESACIRGDIARRAANLVAKEEPFGRACSAEVALIPHSMMARWVREADRIVMVNGCFLKCIGRVLNNLVDQEKIIHIDALQYYNKYTDIFYMEDVPEAERINTARHVADQILHRLSDIGQHKND